ncbi:Hypothetical protein PHPALM_14033 [Phytophthora palmivora]|uniref:Uncharacterized protein n=1 Tax=Phytophthora palmivora TaxID=4796 RepID=A0A2P4XVS6_9STRA|nr:Hypothetical protein PHPALM_14033 [Phytophthora palmivora]
MLPGNGIKQAKTVGKFNNERATLPFDSDAEVSIVDSTWEKICTTDEHTKIKVTLTGTLAESLSYQKAILGMD